MPTGYTYKVQNGETTSFKDFAMECAKAFGVCIDLKDTPNAEIPEKIEPDECYLYWYNEARSALEEFCQLSDQEKESRYNEYCKEEEKRAKNRRDTKKLEKERYEAMLKKVRAWQPPSSEYENMKAFMIEQLEDSIDFDCRESSFDYPELPCFEEWAEKRKKRLRENITKYWGEWQEEKLQAESRTNWLKLLRESIKNFEK